MDHISGLNRALTEVKGELQTSQENGSQLAAMLTQEQTRVSGRVTVMFKGVVCVWWGWGGGVMVWWGVMRV